MLQVQHRYILPQKNFFSFLGIWLYVLMLIPFIGEDLTAQTCQDASVELSATVQADPPRITINWRANALATNHFIARKLKNSSSWGTVIGSLSGSATQFVDTTVNVGVSYEYRVLRMGANFTGYGYVNAGIEIPAVHSRGILLLVVDSTFIDVLAAEIERLKTDMEGDGWRVKQINVSRSASVMEVKALLVAAYNEDKPNTKAAFLLGRIPVPYSGDIYIDGHQPDHRGAWPADVYYADMNGTWTDNSVNVTGASEVRHRNVPGDGKFDQSELPNDVELQLGRVDFANLPSFAASEEQLLKQYLDKDHAYRHKEFTAAYRGVVDDNFGFLSGEVFAASGWKNFSPLVGTDNVIVDDYFTVQRDSSFLWSYGCGGGWYQGAGGIGSTGDFAVANLKSVFTMLFGSYFGDWDSSDNFLRAPLAQGTTLTNAWSGRPHWVLHHMGLGENIGYSTRLTQNNSGLYFLNIGGRFTHIALMGDPTLRNDVVAPAGNLIVAPIGNYHQLTWSPSPDPVAGYHIYVKSEADPAYRLLNEAPLPDIAYAHLCVPDTGLLTYMVRAVTLQQSHSGTYYNLSQGITDTITHAGIPEVDAQASWDIVNDVVSFTNLSTNAAIYEWNFGDGETSSEANPTHEYKDGYFNGYLIASSGCDADTFYFDVLIFTGIKDITDDPSITLAPNPSRGLFVLNWTDTAQPADIRVYAQDGRLVFGKNQVAAGSEIDLRDSGAGVYVMHIIKNDVISYKRLVIQR